MAQRWGAGECHFPYYRHFQQRLDWRFCLSASMQRHATVTPASWWHVPGLSRLIRESRRRRSGPPGEPGEAIVWSPRWSPSLALLQSVWTAPVPGVRAPVSIVATQDKRPVGLGQLAPRKEPHQWEVAYLAVEPAAAGGAGTLRVVPDRNAARLLGALCDAAVSLRADRVLARVSDEGGRYELFRQIGFSLAVREFSYFRTLPEPIPGKRLPPRLLARRVPGLRPQRRADAFGLQQLYQDCTPKMLQLAEGKRSHSWELQPVGFGTQLTRRAGVERWVVEHDGRKVAWLHIQRVTRGPHQVRILVDNRAGELDQSLVDFSLDALASGPPSNASGAMVRVREHQTRLITALESSQFFLVDVQLLMAKLLAAPVLQPRFAPSLEKVV